MSTPWDALLARRTLGVAVALLLLAIAIVVSTDEMGSTWSSRAARLLVLAPVLGGVACALVVARARRRGELRALAASGASPSSSVRGAVVGGALPGVLAAALLSARVGTLGALFPVLSSSPLRAAGEGFVAEEAGLRIDRGIVTFFPPRAVETASREPRVLLAALVLAASLLIPAWSARTVSGARRALSGGLSALVAVVAFHLVAAGSKPAWLLAPLLPLCVDLLLPRRPRIPLGGGGDATTVAT